MVPKMQIHQALNGLIRELEGKKWLCGDRFSAADIYFYSLTRLIISQPANQALLLARKNVVDYFM